MSAVSQFLSSGGGGGSGKINRRIFVGPQTTTWTCPETTTLVEVHCWGGGGNGATPGSGGGGGYAAHEYKVNGNSVFNITVGGVGAASSVSCPSLTPTSPISATGGSPGGSTRAGGTGTVSIGPGQPTAFTMTASGGSGAVDGGFGAGGGSAGFIYGPGGPGATVPSTPGTYYVGGSVLAPLGLNDYNGVGLNGVGLTESAKSWFYLSDAPGNRLQVGGNGNLFGGAPGDTGSGVPSTAASSGGGASPSGNGGPGIVIIYW